MTRMLVSLIITVSLLTTLSACGRRGSLDAPSAAANPPAAEKTAPVEDKSFVLDRLIQ